MSTDRIKELYRIDLGGVECRSSEALVTLNLLEIDLVEAVTLGRDGTLLVVTPPESNVYDDLIRAVVTSGLDPRSLTMSEFRPAADPMPPTAEEAQWLGLVEPPKVPVRASVQTLQRISVAVTDGYDPDTIIISAGMPAEITFSEGHGCLGRVVFEALGIDADLEQGGAVLHIPALEAGTYPFRCGMDMVHGTLIVE